MRAWSLLSFSTALLALTLGGASVSRAQAAGAFKVDASLAEWGKRVWNMKQCFGCHELGREQSTGPNWIGVTDRRSLDWIRKWLKNPVEMAGDDSVAAALKKQYNSQMPNLSLTPHDIEGLINYLAQQTQMHGGQ